MKKALASYGALANVHVIHLPSVGYVRLPHVCAVTGLGRSTIWAWIRQHRFPAPTKLSSRTSAWRVEELRIWLADPTAWRGDQRHDVEGV